jgi:hypothetical protein
MATDTVQGHYGYNHATGEGYPCDVITYATGGGVWYVVAGSQNVNFTHEEIDDGVDVESVCDSDTATAARPIDDESDLAAFIDESEL